MNRSNSFLTVLKVFPDFFSCVSGPETGRYNLVLPILWNSNFTPSYPPLYYEVSNSFLTVLRVFADFFSCVFGLKTSQHILILSLFRDSNFTLISPP